MKLFNKKREDKIYSLSAAMKLLQTKKYNNYTTIPVENGFIIVKMEKINMQHEYAENSIVSMEKREKWLASLPKHLDSTDYTQNYNNYQDSKRYIKYVNYANYR